MSKFTAITDAHNFIADALCLSMEGARWVYENTDCPDWDDEDFSSYDFLADPVIREIPADYIG